MVNQGFKQSTADPCLFVRNTNGNKLLVLIYVDDGLIAGSDEHDLEGFVHALQSEFQVKVHDPNNYLGIQIKKDKQNGNITLDQEAYTQRILQKFGMESANPVSTPTENSVSISSEEPFDEVEAYRTAVGMLLFLATGTRPDIIYAVSTAAQKVQLPTKGDWQRVKRIFRYLRGTTNLCLEYKQESQGGLEGFTDADFATDADRRSRTGIVCKYAESPISWSSQKQASVSLSTCESEYIAASEGAKQLVWLRRLFGDLANDGKPTLYVDNAGAVRLSKNPEFHKRSKHISVRYHFVRERYEDGSIDVKHIEGTNQVADICTKGLPRPRFQKLREMLGISKLRGSVG